MFRVPCRSALLGFLALFAANIALACDPNQECSQCLIHNPFGGCTLRGNNPLCEAAKATCQACVATKAAAANASVACVVCVVGAISTGGAAGTLCAAICGSAGLAEGVAQTGGC